MATPTIVKIKKDLKLSDLEGVPNILEINNQKIPEDINALFETLIESKEAQIEAPIEETLVETKEVQIEAPIEETLVETKEVQIEAPIEETLVETKEVQIENPLEAEVDIVKTIKKEREGIHISEEKNTDNFTDSLLYKVSYCLTKDAKKAVLLTKYAIVKSKGFSYLNKKKVINHPCLDVGDLKFKHSLLADGIEVFDIVYVSMFSCEYLKNTPFKFTVCAKGGKFLREKDIVAIYVKKVEKNKKIFFNFYVN
jgi:hypothetical protein